MSRIFFIAALILLTSDISVIADGASHVYHKNQSYKAAGRLMSIFQLADLETETETQSVIRNSPGVILSSSIMSHFSIRNNQNNSFTAHLIFDNRPVFIVQHKLII